MANGLHKRNPRTPNAAAAQSQLIWRALVGSLVFCAALAAPARAQVAQPETPNAPQEAETAPSPFPAINTSPFKDLLAKALRLRADGSLTAEETFDFTLEADRGEDGTLRDVALTGGASDADGAWRGLATDFVTALGESRLLAALRDALHVSIHFRLDAQSAVASMTCDTASEGLARRAAANYGALLHVASFARQGTDAGLALKNLQVSSSGKQVAFKLEMSREQLGNLLRRSLSIP
jgi:hypothetical protein